MATTSPLQAIPLPEPTDPVNVPTDLALAVGDLEERVVMRFGSSGTRDATVSVPAEGMVAWLQDENRLSIYDGTTWQKTNVSLAGLSSARPAPATLPEGSTYYETDTDLLKIRQGSAGSETWKVVNYARAGTKANRPGAASVPTGTLYYGTDVDVLWLSNGSAWVLASGRPTVGGVGTDSSALVLNATEKTVASLTIGAEAEFARKILVTAFVSIQPSDTSPWNVKLLRNSVLIAQARISTSASGWAQAHLSRTITLSAGATAAERTFDLTVVRHSGTGTATAIGVADACRIETLEVPA